ncbi:hypothetical protein [Pseudomonas sp. CLCA07]
MFTLDVIGQRTFIVDWAQAVSNFTLHGYLIVLRKGFDEFWAFCTKAEQPIASLDICNR